jgi:hypothetical protein
MNPDRANSVLLGLACGGALGRLVEFVARGVAGAWVNADALPDCRLAAISELVELWSPADRLVGVA